MYPLMCQLIHQCNFSMDHDRRMFFDIFKWLKKIKRRIIFCDTKKFDDNQISEPITKVLLKYRMRSGIGNSLRTYPS